MPQLRQNIITGEWVVIAPERAKRPSDFTRPTTQKPADTPLPDSPFKVGGEAWRHRFKEADTKHTFTIPNLYPAFVCDEKMCETRSYYPEAGFYRAKGAVGEHDVIVIKDQNLDLYSFTLPVWEDLLLTMQARYLLHSRDERTEYVMGIYNHGPRAGASIRHPHAQVFASPIVPNYVQNELEGAEKYFNNNGVNVFADLVQHEQKEKVRVLAENKDFIAFTFFAARFPFEIWVLPTAQESHIGEMKRQARSNLAKIMRRVMNMIATTLDQPDLNFWLHCLPTTVTDTRYYRWHIEIAPRVVGYGGYELGSGVIIDIMSPEKAAEYLRN